MSVLDASGNPIKDKNYEILVKALSGHKTKLMQLSEAIDTAMQQMQHLGLYTEFLYKEIARNFDELNAKSDTKLEIRTEDFANWAESRIEEMREMAKEFFEKQGIHKEE